MLMHNQMGSPHTQGGKKNKNKGKSKPPNKATPHAAASKEEKPAETEGVTFSCRPCEKEFTKESQYEAHCKTHVTCNKAGCDFTATQKVVIAHNHATHGQYSGKGLKQINIEGQKFTVLCGTDPDDVAKWREARRRNFPTAENMKKREEERQKLIEAGVIMPFSRRGRGRNRGRGRGRGGNPGRECDVSNPATADSAHPLTNNNTSNTVEQGSTLLKRKTVEASPEEQQEGQRNELAQDDEGEATACASQCLPDLKRPKCDQPPSSLVAIPDKQTEVPSEPATSSEDRKEPNSSEDLRDDDQQRGVESATSYPEEVKQGSSTDDHEQHVIDGQQHTGVSLTVGASKDLPEDMSIGESVCEKELGCTDGDGLEAGEEGEIKEEIFQSQPESNIQNTPPPAEEKNEDDRNTSADAPADILGEETQGQQKCQYFMRGKCYNGAKCARAHVPNTRACKHFMTGKCRKGKKCNYSHSEEAHREFLEEQALHKEEGQNSLLKKLLKKEMDLEASITLQAIKFIVESDFFGSEA